MIEILMMLGVLLALIKPKGWTYVKRGKNVMLVPIRKAGEFRYQAFKRVQAMQKRKFTSMQGIRFVISDISAMIRYSHYRYAKYLGLQADYKYMIPWRWDMYVKVPWLRLKYNGWMIGSYRVTRDMISKAAFAGILFFAWSHPGILAGIPILLGANYYFSPTGDDTYDGSSPVWIAGLVGPKKTQDGHNDMVYSLAPGDIVYWEGGGDFRASVVGGTDEALLLWQDGALGNPITYTTYGGGAHAVLEYVAGEVNYITMTHLHIDNQDQNFNTEACIQWNNSGTNINAGLTFTYIEAEKGLFGFYIHGPAGVGLTCDHIDVHDMNRHVFYVDSGSTNHMTDITLTNWTVDTSASPVGNAADGMAVHEGGSMSSDYVEGPVLIHTWTWTGASALEEFTFDLVSGTYGEMYNCTVPDAQNGCLSMGHTAGKSPDSDGSFHVHNCIFISTQYYAIGVEGANFYYYNCLIIVSGYRGIVVSDGGYAYQPAPGTNASWPNDNIHFIHCTMIDLGTLSNAMFRIIYDSASGGYTATGFYVTNCILVSYATGISFGGVNIGSWAIDDGSVNFDYNCWYDPGGSISYNGFSLSTFATFQAGGHEAHGLHTDPKISDITGGTLGWPHDADLLGTSPCKTAGLAITTGSYFSATGNPTTGITVDYYGFLRSLATPSMGFMEYGVAGVIAPTVTTQSPTSVSYTTCTGNGNITDLGDAEVHTRGFKVNTSQRLVGALDYHEHSSYPTGAYTMSVDGLTDDTVYYICAYAESSAGAGYGSWVQFTTLDLPHGSMVIESGDTIEIDDGDDLSDFDFVIDSGGKFTWVSGASFKIGNLVNNGQVGEAGLAIGSVDKGSVSGSGVFLGGAAGWGYTPVISGHTSNYTDVKNASDVKNSEDVINLEDIKN